MRFLHLTLIFYVRRDLFHNYRIAKEDYNDGANLDVISFQIVSESRQMSFLAAIDMHVVF